MEKGMITPNYRSIALLMIMAVTLVMAIALIVQPANSLVII